MNPERRFAVIFGAHGITPEAPIAFDLTQAEAEAQAADWRARADTVGGTADIIEKP